MNHAHTHNLAMRRKRRTRSQIRNSQLPRLSVHKTLRSMYAQVIDDTKGITLVAAEAPASGNKTERATALGTEIAKMALTKNVTAVVFDRGSYQYHGRVAALAEAARAAGLQF
jgi:large subunit ribosomal protein L18